MMSMLSTVLVNVASGPTKPKKPPLEGAEEGARVVILL
jgi:hypothetical protein